MHFKHILIISFCLGLTGPLSAGVQQDKQFLTDYLLSEQITELLHETAAREYAKAYEGWLQRRSVKVKSPAQLRKSLPDAVSEQWIKAFKPFFIAHCLSDYPDAVLREAADDIRRTPVGPSVNTGGGEGLNTIATQAGEVNRAVAKAARDRSSSRSQVELGGVICSGFALQKMAKDQRSRLVDEQTLDLTYLLELLDAKELFEFPNRIVKRAVIKEAQAAVN